MDQDIQSLWDLHKNSEPDYLKWAQARFQNTASINGDNIRSATTLLLGDESLQEEINYLFKYGKDLEILTATYSQFRGFLGGWYLFIEPYCYRFASHCQRSYRTRYYDRHKVDFRERMSYRQTPGKQKKKSTEASEAKKAWRKRKGFAKDQGKTSYRRGYSQQEQQDTNRFIRHTNRRKIKAGRDEQLPKIKKGFWRFWW